jgi:hypothetical protein
MAMPPNIRVNARVGFPAQVFGGAGIAIQKVNGIYTILLNILAFGSATPPPANFPTDFLLGYDTVNQQFFRISLTALASALATAPRAQRLVTASPITVGAADQIINTNIATAATCTLPSYATRAGSPLTFADVGGQCGANNITITPAGAETINGLNAAVVMRSNHQVMTLVPANDGTTTGWTIE